jgi:hypothetical protein
MNTLQMIKAFAIAMLGGQIVLIGLSAQAIADGRPIGLHVALIVANLGFGIINITTIIK